MEQQNQSQMTKEQIEPELQKIKSAKLVNAVLIGFLVGVAIFSLVRKGFTAFGVLPFVFAFILLSNRKKTEAQEKELLEKLNKTN